MAPNYPRPTQHNQWQDLRPQIQIQRPIVLSYKLDKILDDIASRLDTTASKPKYQLSLEFQNLGHRAACTYGDEQIDLLATIDVRLTANCSKEQLQATYLLATVASSIASVVQYYESGWRINVAMNIGLNKELNV